MGLDHFPFKTLLSMRPLMEYWSTQFSDESQRFQHISQEIQQYVDKHPSILESYDDSASFIAEHEEIVDLLFGGVFPLVMTDNLLGYAAPPFVMRPFYVTYGLQLLVADSGLEIHFEQLGELHKIPYSIRACIIILQKYYGADVEPVMPLIFRLQHEDTSLERYYKTTSLLDFLQVKTKKKAPEISEEQLDHLLQNTEDEALWLSTISPEVFYFEGFFFAVMNDVTEMETLSRLRKILLAPNPFMVIESAIAVADLTRNYLGLSDMEMGISALDYPTEHSLAHRYKIHYPIASDIGHFLSPENAGSVYDRACQRHRIQTISDLRQLSSPAPIERALINGGFRSLMVVPLRDQKKRIIGLIELASPRPYIFTRIKELKFKEILPLYDIAIEESRKFVENRIQSVIQEQFTNIHPSIQWKFTETAFNYLVDQDHSEEVVSLEEIRFGGIYPLFGQVDINSSTEIRNRAVKADVLKNLMLLESVIGIAYEKSRFHLLKKYAYEVKHKLFEVQNNFDSGLETIVSDLLLDDIHPVLRQLRENNPVLAEKIDEYFNALHPRLQIVFEAREDYEKSLNKINRTIGSYLDEQEIINQKVIPHYFEKYKTDGFEYTMYLGQSLLQHGHFSIHHLQNLRLWQLKSMVELHHILENQRPSLSLDMTVSYLILVFNSTLNISFRMEEKRFDVDGAYHIRYEVLKKRVDKALIAGTKKRLTCHDKISIVFLQDKDKQEYLAYLQYLIEEELLDNEIEEVDLEKVQGVQGLKALRVAFKKQ